MRSVRPKCETVECRFPCGGVLRIDWSYIVNADEAGFVNEVDEAVVPELRCRGRYRPSEGCPWIKRLGEFCGLGVAKEQATVDAEPLARSLNPEVEYGQGRRTTVFDCNPNCGIVLSGKEVFEDARFWAICHKADKRFYECQNEVKHGGIIAFLARLFGRGRKGQTNEH